MKKLLLLSSLLILAVCTNAQVGTWVSKSTGFTPVSSGVKFMSVVDTNVVWGIAYDGDPNTGGLPRQDYTRTTDGGNTWTAGTVPVGNVWDWAGITATSDSMAWAIFYEAQITQTGQIWHTTDGGTTWTQQAAGLVFTNTSTSFPNNIYFWNDTTGLVIGDQVNGVFEIYTTDDGGATWDSVPAANIPAPIDASEDGWTTHFSVVGDSVWWDSNEGRVFRSGDRGHTWTASSTTAILPVITGDAIDICFTDGNNGIARFYDDAATPPSSTVAQSTDGGASWTQIFPSGDLFGGDIKRVPGVPNMIVSTGISSTSGYTGSSYTTDGGLTWITIETGTQRGALGIADSLTMWCGGFTTSPTSDGIYKYVIPIPIACNDPSVTTGTASVDDSVLCQGETATFTATGVVSPVVGNFSGVSWVISAADITGSLNPILEPSIVTSYLFTYPAPSTSIRTFTNDGTLIGAGNYGDYYWTPVVFGNATEATVPAQFLQDLSLDNNCTITGTSIKVSVLDPNDPICVNGINNIDANNLAVFTRMNDQNTLDVLINSSAYGKVSIQILDVTGRLQNSVKSYVSKGSNHEYINVEGLSAGTYIVKCEVNGYHAINKVIKN